MKKSMLLAMAMSLAICGGAYAANPFEDVPAGHWAYASIAKLAAAGVIDGYEDGSFRGDRLMTRYEMAQIVARAMAKSNNSAQLDRLAAEFSNELDALGVRVANLEKKSDNVKITGEVRFHAAKIDAKGGVSAINGHSTGLRSRLWINGQVNDNWKYVGMLENIQNFSDNTGNEDVRFQRAYVEGNLGGVRVKGGRFHQVLAEGNLYNARMDGLALEYGNKVKVGGYVGRTSDDYTVAHITGFDKAYGVNVKVQLGKKVELAGGYDRFDDNETADREDVGVWNVGLTADIAKDTRLGFMYLKSDMDDIPDTTNKGFVVKAEYGGAKNEKVGSFGLGAKYYDQGVGTFFGYDSDPMCVAGAYSNQGFKGFSVGANYTVAKNMILGAQYYDLKGKERSEDKTKVIWGDLTVRF